jgi:hypothetical protein
MTPTEPDQTDPELDGFWRDLRDQIVPDYLHRDDAELRMVEDAEPLPEATVHRIVDHVTRKAALSSPPPQPAAANVRQLRSWRFTQAAAAGTFTALLLSAGIAYVMWPENKDSSGKHGDGMRFDHATLIVSDPGQDSGRRQSALFQTFTRVKLVIMLLKEISAEGGGLGRAADAHLLRLRLSLGAPEDVEFHEGTAPYLAPLIDQVRDPGATEAERAQDLQALVQESLYGLSSIFEARVTGGHAEFLRDVENYVAKLKKQFD